MLGSLQNLCVIDIVLRDGRGRLTWAVSEFVVCVPNDKAKVSYDYDDQGRIIQYKGAYRELALTLDKVRDLDILVCMYVYIHLCSGRVSVVSVFDQWFFSQL